MDPASKVDVIVQFAKQPTRANHQRILDRGGEFKRDLSIIKARHYSVPASALADLASDPDVVSISPDRAVRGLLDLTADAVNAHVAWQSYGLSGDDIGVAVIDSGIATSADLPSSQVVYSQSFVGGNTGDSYGHGTHVAGILASNGHSSSCSNCFRSFLGIASGVNLINLRVLDQNGNGTDSNVIAALQTAVSLKWRYNIQVINLSLGRPVFESYTKDPLCQAVDSWVSPEIQHDAVACGLFSSTIRVLRPAPAHIEHSAGAGRKERGRWHASSAVHVEAEADGNSGGQGPKSDDADQGQDRLAPAPDPSRERRMQRG